MRATDARTARLAPPALTLRSGVTKEARLRIIGKTRVFCALEGLFSGYDS
ncbi:hypothetical protein [Novosphingobium percolationis]|nr:hypothetical protein [Novosphingobium percolationis]